MPRVEQSSKELATLAGRILAGYEYTRVQVFMLAASVLSQAKPKVKKRAK